MAACSSGCTVTRSSDNSGGEKNRSGAGSAAPGGVSTGNALETRGSGPCPKPGFITEVEDGRLWVLKPGQKKSGKHVTLIAAGPAGMTMRAVDKATAFEYLGTKAGFDVHAEKVGDSYALWVLKPGQKKSGKHITLVAAGPRGMTLRAVSKATAYEYLSAKPGFEVHVEKVGDSRALWVLKPGQKKSGKHVTLVAAGPKGMTIRAVSKATALEYLAARPGFDVHVEKVGDSHALWVLKPGQKKSGKHVTLVAAGPRGMTIRAVSKATALEYLGKRDGFKVKAEKVGDSYVLWVLRPGQKKSGKHITLVAAGPGGLTLRAVDHATADAYKASL